MQTEPSGKNNQGDPKVVAFIKKRYEDKDLEFEKRRIVREYLSKYMQKLLGSEGEEQTKGLFTSNLMLGGYEFVTTAKLFPDSTEFSPTQENAPEKLKDTAENYSSLVSYVNTKGGYDKMVSDSGHDMAMGQTWVFQEYQKKDGKAIKIQQKHLKWENVRGFYGDTDLVTIENLTMGQLVENYGPEILKKVQYGFPFEVKIDFEETSVDLENLQDRDRMFGVIKYWDYALKKHNVLIGGGSYQPKEMQMDETNYFWEDDDGDGFCPVKKRVYQKPARGYHGYGVLDKLYPLAYLETVIVNSSSHAAVLASDPLLVFYADEIDDIKNKWNQYLATKRAGSQSPFFINQNRSNPIKTDQLAFQPDINIFETWEKFCTDQATIRTRIDYRILLDYAPTDGQQKSRKYETDKTNRFVLAANSDEDKAFAMETIYMLKRGDSEFHKKTLYTKVGDYFYAKKSQEDKDLMKDANGQYSPVPVKISEFLEANKETEFSLNPRLDGILDDQSFFEMQDARNDIGLLDPASEASVKLKDFYFTNKYGKVRFNREDFGLPQPEVQEALPGAPLPQ